MVKGISRQVIVVHPTGEEIFDQAIFLLKNDVVSKGITDEILLKQAQQAIGSTGRHRRRSLLSGMVWACSGALATALVWLLTAFL